MGYLAGLSWIVSCYGSGIGRMVGMVDSSFGCGSGSGYVCWCLWGRVLVDR